MFWYLNLSFSYIKLVNFFCRKSILWKTIYFENLSEDLMRTSALQRFLIICNIEIENSLFLKLALWKNSKKNLLLKKDILIVLYKMIFSSDLPFDWIKMRSSSSWLVHSKISQFEVFLRLNDLVRTFVEIINNLH